MTRFRSIFDNVKLLCGEQEFALINKRFQAKAANEINYVEFDHVLREYSGDHQPYWTDKNDEINGLKWNIRLFYIVYKVKENIKHENGKSSRFLLL